MADAAAIIARVRGHGANIELTPAGLHIVNRNRLPAGAVEFITANRAEIAAFLTDEQVEIEERAAIVEFDGHAPREWAQQFARLLYASKPAGVDEMEWTWFLTTCGRMIDSAPARAA